MLIELQENIYTIKRIYDPDHLRVIVTDGKLNIEFQFMDFSKGWASVHNSINDPIFPIDDVWDIVEQLDFIYIMKYREN
jgi:hypothetical protein